MSAIERIKTLSLWQGAVEPQPLKGGLSNESFTVEDAGARYVVRLGRDFPMHHVFRDRERDVSAAAFAAGFAPELVHAEPGVMVFAYIDGHTFAEPDVQANVGRIASLVRGYHTAMPKHVRGPAALFWVFHVIRDYTHTLEEGASRMRDRLAGYVALVPRQADSRLQISKLYLRKPWRGRGLGSAILARIAAISEELGYTRLYLTVNKHNAPAIAAYEKLGFTRTGELVTDIGGGFVMDDYEMQKTLSESC